MPAENTDVVVEEAGNDVKVAFDANIKIFAEDELLVKKKLADGTYTAELLLDTDYTVEFDTEEETVIVTYTVAPVTSGGSAIARRTELTQGTAIPTEGPFPSSAMQNIVDRLTNQVQEISERLDRAPLQPQLPSDPESIAIDPPTDRRAMVYEEQDDGSFLVVPSDNDPDELVEQAEDSADDAATSAAAAASSASSAASSASAAAASAVVAATYPFTYLEGLASARPATPSVRTFYYSTDTDQLEVYLPTAANWRLL